LNARSTRRWVEVELPCKSPEDMPAAYAAAYLASRNCFIQLQKTAKGLGVALSPKEEHKGPLEHCADFLQGAFADMKLRWAMSLAGRDVRQKIFTQALSAPDASVAARPPELSPEQAAEIAALVSEGEEEPFVDEKKVSTPWSVLRERGEL
jgi:hypothetical protein